MSNVTSEKGYIKRITVFTPTYNRAYIIHNLYDSLKRQSFHDFEWLVVDDGSTDNTKDVLEKWIEEDNSFSLRYYKQANGGKHRAINRGLELAKGEIFFLVDSDDYLTDDALEKVNRWFKTAEGVPSIVSIAANKGTSPSETINAFFDEKYLDKTFLDMRSFREHGELVLNGERAIAFYTDIHRKYFYPEYDGEKFLTEAIVYNRMAHDGYRTRFFNDIIWIYEYLEDGLSSKGTDIYLDNPYGYGLWFREIADFSGYSLIQKWKMKYSFYCDLKDRCTKKKIAECIGASVLEIQFIALIHSLKNKLFKRNQI